MLDVICVMRNVSVAALLHSLVAPRVHNVSSFPLDAAIFFSLSFILIKFFAHDFHVLVFDVGEKAVG